MGRGQESKGARSSGCAWVFDEARTAFRLCIRVCCRFAACTAVIFGVMKPSSGTRACHSLWAGSFSGAMDNDALRAGSLTKNPVLIPRGIRSRKG